ncbi:hypothetical protein SBRCBS47491_002494 [Sporothrix bragantina]|uniref:Cyclohexanone monooxygenase n=1 Tax=Sporothrix bragantina TaxID=671064 RepID=A0ABP0B7J4_9PEZI
MGSVTNGNAVTETDVVVVGAGFSGLYVVHSLAKLGFNVRAFEKAPDVGGTWYWNRYPGARCDSESLTYCYTFDEQLFKDWVWSERYPSGPEVLKYLRHVADRFNLRRYFQFETAIQSAVYDEAVRRWTITASTGEVLSARFFVTAVGNLSVPATPTVPGIDTFQGQWLHTGRWPLEPIDFTGKRVAVIGTGSSGVQVIQEIAKTADHLTVFQRTPTFTIPLRNLPLDPDVQRLWKSNYRELTKKSRYSDGGLPFFVSEKPLKGVSAEEQKEGLERAWGIGGFRFLFGTFCDIGSDHEANKVAADFVRGKIADIVKDPATRETLTPTAYPLGAKRIPLDTAYFQVYNQDNVSLVNLQVDPISKMTPKGLVAGTTEHEFDLVIFATGFEAITGPLLQMDIVGRGGQKLNDTWADGPYAYMGVGVPGFPNLLTLGGPGGVGVISNVPPTAEQAVEFAAECIAYLRDHQIDEIEATTEATDLWNEHVRAMAQKTMYPYAPSSWYNGSNLGKKPRPFPAYTGGFGKYRRICDAVAAEGYTSFKTHRQGDKEVTGEDNYKAHDPEWYIRVASVPSNAELASWEGRSAMWT